MTNLVLLIKTNNKELADLYRNMKVTTNDAGIDLYVPDNIQGVAVDGTKFTPFTVDHQIQCELVAPSPLLGTTGTNLHYYMFPRSSISKQNFMLHNGVGVIDKSYRGNIMAKCLAYGPFSIKKHSRLFQLVPKGNHCISKIEVVNELSSTERGTGGFGSTGT